MAPTSFKLSLLAAAALPALAVAEDIDVWAAAGFVMYGDRTPLNGPTTPAITPLGAQQLYGQGSTFRNRYVRDGLGNESTDALLPIYGIEPHALDSTQLAVLSTDDSYVVASAQAFLQGLYPPQLNEYAYDNGGSTAATVASTDTTINFPLVGYQYPHVSTASQQDPSSAWVAGQLQCSAYQASAIDYRRSTAASEMYSSTLSFYEQIWPAVFEGVYSESTTNFYNAYDLYDYASYQYAHDSEVHSTLNQSEINALRTYASVQQRALSANLTATSATDGRSNNMIRAIAGRMLAQQAVNQLRQNMVSSGASNKLSLTFGSYEPLISFFALSGLLDGPDAGDFQMLPAAGATMVFELYSLASDRLVSGNNTLYPEDNELHVRFLYRAGVSSTDDWGTYSLFPGTDNNTNSALNMTYSQFSGAMKAVGVDSVADWCDMCDAAAVFCPGMLENAGYTSGSGSGSGSGSSSSGSSSSGKKISPALAGVIGAIVTLAVFALPIAAFLLFGKVRLAFVPKSSGSFSASQNKNKRLSNNSATAGFKGEERKVQDADVAVSRSGVGHERVGSWELRGGNPANSDATPIGASTPGSPTGDLTRPERVRSTIINRRPDNDDDDDMAHFGRPVDPREHV
ncbi:histidine acid phosphatase [Ophiostoma piceae UAMH 11346]|uniref:Histidine acid phosphatase n=1 Tax=Ophiostoma piceae (strain UAMH 11346) TaxID=1262450 RepID=S3C5K5_OPHP1|nr:histidine acid phosphatase [Ophiostoma piceae UAMH 11346]